MDDFIRSRVVGDIRLGSKVLCLKKSICKYFLAFWLPTENIVPS